MSIGSNIMNTLTKNISFIFLIISVLSGCAGGPVNSQKQSSIVLQNELETILPPQWVLGKEHPIFPMSKYIVGRGISKENSVTAAENARMDLAKAIKVNIRSKMMDYSNNRWTNIESVVESEVEAVLEGVEIRDGWFDKYKKNYYAYAVMNRKNASQSLKNRIKLTAAKLNLFLEEGANETKKNDIQSALSTYTYGYKEAENLESLIAMFNVIDRNINQLKEFQVPSQQTFESKAKNILNKMSLSVISGNRQIVRLSKIPSDALSVKVSLLKGRTNYPLKNVPVNFIYTNKAGILDEDVLTNNAGIAKTVIKKITSYDQASHRVLARINLSKIVPGIKEGDLPNFFNKIKNLKVEFNIIVETTKNLSEKTNLLKQKMLSLAKQSIHNIKSDSSHILGIFNFKNFNSDISTDGLSKVIKKDFEEILSGVEGFVVREIKYPNISWKDKTKIAMDNNLDIYITGGYRLIADNIEIRVRLLETVTNNILGSGKILIRKEDIYPGNFENLSNTHTSRPFRIFSESNDDLKETLLNLNPKDLFFNLKLSTDKSDYHVGEKLNIFVKTSMPCYLTLLDFSPDGFITVLFPNGSHEDNLISANKLHKIPPKYLLGEGKPFSFMIQKPSGLDRIKAFCSTQNISPIKYSFKSRVDYHTIDPKTTHGIKDIKSILEIFSSNKLNKWAEAYNEIFIFDKGLTYMRGKKTIPILETPEKPKDMIGSFGNKVPAPQAHGDFE
jgi:hypothetical protein